LPDCPNRHVDAILFADQVADRRARPQRRGDAQLLGAVLVDESAQLRALLVTEGTARTEGAAGPLVGQASQTVGLVGAPPPRDGLAGNTEYLSHVALAEAHLAAAQGAQAQFQEDFIGQLASIRQCDGHGSLLLLSAYCSLPIA